MGGHLVVLKRVYRVFGWGVWNWFFQYGFGSTGTGSGEICCAEVRWVGVLGCGVLRV